MNDIWNNQGLNQAKKKRKRKNRKGCRLKPKLMPTIILHHIHTYISYTVQNITMYTHGCTLITSHCLHASHRWLYECWNMMKYEDESISSLFFLSIHLIFHPKHRNQHGQHFILSPELQIKHRHTHKQTAMFVYPRTNALRYAHTCTVATRTNNNHGHPYLWRCMIECTHTYMQIMWLWFEWSNFSWWTAWGLVEFKGEPIRAQKRLDTLRRKLEGRVCCCMFTLNLSHGSKPAKTFHQRASQL